VLFGEEKALPKIPFSRVIYILPGESIGLSSKIYIIGLPGISIPARKLITGQRTRLIKDIPPKIGKIRKSRINIPYRLKNTSAS